MYTYTYCRCCSDLPHHGACEVLLIIWDCVTIAMKLLLPIRDSIQLYTNGHMVSSNYTVFCIIFVL